MVKNGAGWRNYFVKSTAYLKKLHSLSSLKLRRVEVLSAASNNLPYTTNIANATTLIVAAHIPTVEIHIPSEIGII